ERLRALFRAGAPPEGEAREPARSIARPPRQLKPAPPLALDTPIEQISGVGKATAQALRRLGIRTVHDMLYHFPHRYDDYTSQKRIAELQIGAVETVVATVEDVRTIP